MFKLLFCMLYVSINCVHAQNNSTFLSVPGYNKIANINPEGISVLPSGRYISPAGNTIKITNDPFGLAISPNGKISITLHDGVITVIDNDNLKAVRIPEYNNKSINPLKNGSFIGLAFDTVKNIVFFYHHLLK